MAVDLNLLNERPVEENSLAKYCRELKKDCSLDERVLLVNVPQVRMDIFDPRIAKNRGYQVYPPVGLKYLAQALEDGQLDIDILDMNYEVLRRTNFDTSFDHREWMSILEERLTSRKPSIVGVSNMFEIYEPNFIEILKFLREKKENLVVLAGGTAATYKARSLVERGLAHFVVQREAENKVRYLFKTLFEEESLPMPGIVFMQDGKVKTTGAGNDSVSHTGNLIEQHRKFPLRDYYKVGTLGPMSRMAGDDVPFATLLITRGCRFKCSFCSVRDFNGKGLRSRDTQDVLDEMRYLHDKQGVKHFELLDDDFTGGSREQVIDVLRGIRNEGMDITWSAQNGLVASSLDGELLREIADSKCVGFKIGVESGNPRMLKKVEKPGSIQTFRAFAQRMKEHPRLIVPHNYIIGFDDETFGEMMDTYRFSGEIQTDWCAFSVYQPIADKKPEGGEVIVGNYHPIKSKREMQLECSSGLKIGPDIFKIYLDEVPSRPQIEQIWCSFNLCRNFIHNNNLKPGGRPEKFIKYVGALQKNYPLNPYMPFFLALAHQSLGNEEEAAKYISCARKNLDRGNEKEMFEQFRLVEHVKEFPRSRRSAVEILDEIRRTHQDYQ